MKPVIYLINPLSHRGHLDTYARLYSLCLLELGYRVVFITDQESGLAEWLAARVDGLEEKFSISLLTASIPSGDSFVSRVRHVWRQEGIGGIATRVRGRIKRRDVRGAGIDFRTIITNIHAAQERLGLSPALVFFLYLDVMSQNANSCRALDRQLEIPWSGILFHPRGLSAEGSAQVERYFYCRNARGAAFLNFHHVQPYQQHLSQLVFGAVPDVTEVSQLTKPSGLVRRLETRARGRTVVILFGTLLPHKGIKRLLDIIGRADPEKYFFAIIGEILWELYGAEAGEIRDFANDPPENCLVHFGYIEDERELNSLIASSDILYSIYDEAHDSSNSLTKAAAFKKPVLVNNTQLVAERVSRYRIGAMASPDRPEDILSALEILRQSPKSAFGFEAYWQDHALGALKRDLGGLLNAWIG